MYGVRYYQYVVRTKPAGTVRGVEEGGENDEIQVGCQDLDMSY